MRGGREGGRKGRGEERRGEERRETSKRPGPFSAQVDNDCHGNLASMAVVAARYWSGRHSVCEQYCGTTVPLYATPLSDVINPHYPYPPPSTCARRHFCESSSKYRETLTVVRTMF